MKIRQQPATSTTASSRFRRHYAFQQREPAECGQMGAEKAMVPAAQKHDHSSR